MITLLDVKTNTLDALQSGVIDEFAKSNYILQNMPFDDAVSPVGGGGTWTYSYTRLISQPTASFRAVNNDYTAEEVKKERHSVDLKIFGGSFKIDRALAKTGGIISEVQLQSSQKVKAAQALFNETLINGDVDSDANSFDGLDKALKGSATEFNAAGAVIDLSTHSAVKSNYGTFLMQLDEFLAKLDGTPSALLMNASLKARIIACAREYGLYGESKDAFGSQIFTYNGVPLVDMGAKMGSETPVVETATNLTSLYAVRFGTDGLHGVTLPSGSPIEIRLPDFTRAEAVQQGAVEMIASVALKATKAAGVFRKIKV